MKEAVSVPVFANGNILYHSDIERCLAETGADGVMSAEGQLYNAALFAHSQSPISSSSPMSPHQDGLYPAHTQLALEYLQIVESLKTPTPLSAVKGHLFKLMRPGLVKHPDLRDKLGKTRGKEGGGIRAFLEIVEELAERMEKDQHVASVSGETDLEGKIPHWLAQPYFRPLPPMEGNAARDTGEPTCDS